MTPEPAKCSVRDGLFVEPCIILQSVIDIHQPSFSRAKGVFRIDLTSIKMRQPSRSYVGIKSKQYPNGFLFNFCPFCGESIDAPFKDKSE